MSTLKADGGMTRMYLDPGIGKILPIMKLCVLTGKVLRCKLSRLDFAARNISVTIKVFPPTIFEILQTKSASAL